MNTQFFTNNGNQKFPLSTETLNFMQEQIKLAYGLTDLAGENIIVRQSSATETGLVIFDGELLPLTGNKSNLITIAESTESMSVEGRFFGNVRTTRKAVYTNIKKATKAGSSSKTKLASDFTVLKNISTLMSELDAAKQHHVPTGAIMMWSGAITDIPNGWALCDGTNGRPDLRGLFIVGASNGEITMDGSRYKYDVGSTGGKNKVQLTAAESGLPAHTHGMQNAGAHAHKITYYNNGDGSKDKENTNAWAVDGKKNAYPVSDGGFGSKVNAVRINASYGSTWIGNDYIQMKDAGSHSHTVNSNTAASASSAHENRPPYYALAYIIKII